VAGALSPTIELTGVRACSHIQVRERFSVRQITMDNGTLVGIRGHDRRRGSVTERASVVIGGHHSIVARAVSAEADHAIQPPQVGYTYWRHLPVDGFEI
jgi:hypothetical protein